MYKFSEVSLKRLETCHPRLQILMRAALKTGIMDLTITNGYRDEATQNRYYDEGRSRVRYPDGKHNSKPSRAVDVAPFINGNLSYDKAHCCHMAGIILGIAASLGFKVRWGGNWDMDGEPVTDQDFQDLVHFELVS
jgi:peptidoglycan L-alanyl-D-glutamate endopeptidase CwlK